MALEKFIKVGNTATEEKVAIWSKGQIGINRVLVEKRNLKQYKKVVMFFDPAIGQMVFQFTNEETAAGAVNISYIKNNVALISAKPYLCYFGIDHEVSKKYPAHFDEASNTLSLLVSEGVVTVSKKKSKPKVEPVVSETATAQPSVDPAVAPEVPASPAQPVV